MSQSAVHIHLATLWMIWDETMYQHTSKLLCGNWVIRPRFAKHTARTFHQSRKIMRVQPFDDSELNSSFLTSRKVEPRRVFTTAEMRFSCLFTSMKWKNDQCQSRVNFVKGKTLVLKAESKAVMVGLNWANTYEQTLDENILLFSFTFYLFNEQLTGMKKTRKTKSRARENHKIHNFQIDKI